MGYDRSRQVTSNKNAIFLGQWGSSNMTNNDNNVWYFIGIIFSSPKKNLRGRYCDSPSEMRKPGQENLILKLCSWPPGRPDLSFWRA